MTVISDLATRARKSLARTAGAAMLSLHISGKPVPASRPRVSRFGTYYGKTYSRWMKDSWKDVDKIKSVPSDQPIAVICEAVFEKPKTSKLDYPTPDVDNLMKGPLDQLTKLTKETGRGVWEDDKQVVSATSTKRFAKPGEKPGFYLHFYAIDIDEDSE